MRPTTIAVLIVFVAGPASACRSQPAVDSAAEGTAQASSGRPATEVPMESQAKNDHLTVGHRVLDIVNHPAFKGFGELMLPWADNARYYDTRLDRVGSLMPYHSHVDADVVVGALNSLIDEADAGKTIFYEFYTERQKQEDPAKRLTGLFFYRGKPGGRSPSSVREGDSPTSARSTKASRSPGRSARRGSTPS